MQLPFFEGSRRRSSFPSCWALPSDGLKFSAKSGGVLLLFPTLLLFCICLIRIFLKNPISWRILLGRAALAAVAWEIFSLGFRIYLSLVPRTSYLYGGIGAVLLFLIYLRACLWIFLVTFPLLRDS